MPDLPGGAPRSQSWWSKGIGTAVALVLGVAVLPLVLLALPFVAAGVWWDRWRRDRLRRRFQERWGTVGKRVLLVYSNSPHWQSYIEERWLPRLAPVAVVLNWSDRGRWPESHPLEAEIFRRWAGEREFNPVAIVIPPSGPVRTIRFWRAFRDYKHGKDRALKVAERELEAALGIGLQADL